MAFFDFDTWMRLGLALAVGGLIGLNRNVHGKSAGLRTNALVAMGSAFAVLTSRQLATDPAHVADALSRVIQGLLTGTGFIGAGLILHSENGKKVHGLTTAAAVWVSAILGAGCGAGLYSTVLIAVLLVVVLLIVGGPLERWLHRLLRHDGSLPPSID
jgi:putative Mg2+ transporter-C (MgtC) family protein